MSDLIEILAILVLLVWVGLLRHQKMNLELDLDAEREGNNDLVAKHKEELELSRRTTVVVMEHYEKKILDGYVMGTGAWIDRAVSR